MTLFAAILVYIVASYFFLYLFKGKFKGRDGTIAHGLLWYHLVLTVAYYMYAMANASDSKEYFKRTSSGVNTWAETYGTGTPFIDFLVYPFVNHLGFSYESCMALFGAFGYCAFLFFFSFFREHVKGKIDLHGADLMTLFLFLPNMHFWSASLGKGAVIFLGIAMIFYGLTQIKQRALILVLGFLVVYHVRPHIALVILMSSIIGVMFSNKGISRASKLAILIVAGVAFTLVFDNVMQYVGVENTESADDRFAKLAGDLKKANSGIDISNYSLPEKVFAFLYRPLFFDAPNALGIFSSLENLFYLYLTIQMFRKKGLQFIMKSDMITKTAFFSFLTTSIALAQITGNLGLAMRQKSQVMILFLFVLLMYFNDQKKQRMALFARRKALKEKRLRSLQQQQLLQQSSQL